jgi:hypothetical protein
MLAPSVSRRRCYAAAVRRLAALSLLLALAALGRQSLDRPPRSSPHPASRYRAGGEPVVPGPDGLIVCEAEEFQVETPGWQARPWGENYYAATFANTFLSRKAFLGAPERGPETSARIAVSVKERGRYLVLARYEAAYRFETRFRVQVAQAGRVLLDRTYGARDNTKVWAFGKRLQKEVAWDWGAVEGVVWEGHDVFVELEPGVATLRLIASPQPGDAARRNVDLVLLTRDEAAVRARIEKEAYLPLDGLLTQSGDVWIRVKNDGAARVTVESKRFQEHSPYWVHQRSWKPASVSVEPGATSEWIEVGSTMDSLNDGQWGFKSNGPCRLELGVRAAGLRIEPLREFEVRDTLDLVGLADTRYARRVPTRGELEAELLAALRRVSAPGRLPTATPVYGFSLPAIAALFGLTDTSGKQGGPHAYVDWRSQSAGQLEETCRKLDQKRRDEIRVVSLGDEIRLPEPDARTVDADFAAYLKRQGVPASDLGGDASAAPRYSPDPALRSSQPALYYWSQRFRHANGIEKTKELTDAVRRHLKNARIGANFSPHHGGAARAYLQEVFQWVSCFREECLTLPWSEDFAWQLPVGTPQMNEISLDLLRAGVRGKPERGILFYVLAHTPGNTPRMWRRQFHAALAHGMKMVDLFEFQPVWAAWSENHVADPEMYATVLRTLHELGGYEDLLQPGEIGDAEAGLFFSETADIWDDGDPPFAEAKRTLYVALRHAQAPLDLLVEQDALDGTLSRCKVLFLTDRHVSRAASRRIADWVRGGGLLFATAGAGMRDEYDRENAVLAELLPVDVELVVPAASQVAYAKQDLPFAEEVARVATQHGSFPAFGAVARIGSRAGAVTGTFSDGSPAVVERAVGRGRVVYNAFTPALPRRPVDRGAHDDAMSHFLPAEFDRAAGALVAAPLAALERPVATDDPLVESMLIRSPRGLLVPLIDWSARGRRSVRVTLRSELPLRSVSLAGGGRVSESRAGDVRVFDVAALDVADVLVLR